MDRICNSRARLIGAMLLLLAGLGFGQGLGLEDLIRSGLENNAELKVNKQEVNTFSLDTLSVNTAVNPHLEVEGRHELTDSDRESASIRLSREFQPGIRKKMKKASKAEWLARKEWLKAGELDLIQDIRTTYFDWQILNRKAALQREVLARWEGLSRLAAGQVAQGKLSEVDQGQAQLNAVKARQRELGVLSEIGAKEKQLRFLTGQGNIPDTLAPDRLDPLRILPALDTLWLWASKGSPELAALESESEAGRQRLALEKGQAIPAFNLSLGYEREVEGFHMVGGGIEMPLALFIRNQAGVSKARSSLKEAELRKVAALERLRVELAEIHGRLSNLAKRYEYYQTQIRDLSRKQMSLSEKGFRQGMLGIFDLSKVQEEALDQDLEALDILQEYYQSLNQLGRRVGGKIW